ncbi:MAG: hypothetical protein ABI679_16085 [Gemmatimonadota bacterium]
MRFKTLPLLALAMIVPAVCSAQAPKPGKWTGFAVPPNETTQVPLTFDVTVNADSLGIVIHVGDEGEVPASGGHFADKTISFTFESGSSVHCTLTLNAAGAYSGDCVGDDGKAGQMTMVPPIE